MSLISHSFWQYNYIALALRKCKKQPKNSTRSPKRHVVLPYKMVDQLIMGYQRQSAFRSVFEMQHRGYGVDPAPVVRLLLLTAGISTAQARSHWHPLLPPLNLPPRDPAHSSIVRKRPSLILNYLLPTMRNHQRVLRSLVQPLFYLRLLAGYECRMQMLEKNTCEETEVNPRRQMPNHKQMRRFPMY